MRKCIVSAMAVLLALPAVVTAQMQYEASMYPETTAVLQVLHDEAVRSSQTYSAYAAKAYEEEEQSVGGLLAALALSDSVLAQGYRDVLGQFSVEVEAGNYSDEITIRSTKHNVELAANLGLAKVDSRYSVFLEMIRGENHPVAIGTIQGAWDVKKEHQDYLKRAKGSMGLLGFASKNSDQFYVCGVCGSIVTDLPMQECPSCASDVSEFVDVTAKWRAYAAIDQNPKLTGDQKAYAKRTFDSVFDGLVGTSGAAYDTSIFSSALYEKWGLGPERDFSAEEEAYIANIETMAQMWDDYAAIDLQDLSEEERAYLTRMHDEFGMGPIDLSDKRGTGQLSARMESALEQIELLTGSAVLYDAEVVFIKRMGGA